MNHFYVRAGGVERVRGASRACPGSYAWRQGFSRVVDGSLTQPWCTLQEARDGAKLEGVRVVIGKTLEEAVAAEKAHRTKGHFIRFDLWALAYRSAGATDADTVGEVAYELELALNGLDRLQDYEARTAALVHPAQWVVNAWTIHNEKPIGRKPRTPHVCRCARHHVPVSDKTNKPKVRVRCYGDIEQINFVRYHEHMRRGALHEYFKRTD